MVHFLIRKWYTFKLVYTVIFNRHSTVSSVLFKSIAIILIIYKLNNY